MRKTVVIVLGVVGFVAGWAASWVVTPALAAVHGPGEPWPAYVWGYSASVVVPL